MSLDSRLSKLFHLCTTDISLAPLRTFAFSCLPSLWRLLVKGGMNILWFGASSACFVHVQYAVGQHNFQISYTFQHQR